MANGRYYVNLPIKYQNSVYEGENMSKWYRIDELSNEERKELNKLVTETKGLTRYGHRARAAVMLPLSLAYHVSSYALENEVSVGQAIIDLLEKTRD